MANSDQPTKRFLAEYFHDDAWWSVDIYAYGFSDAEIRCRKLSLRLLGEHQFTIPATGGRWIPNLIIRFQNLIRRLKPIVRDMFRWESLG